MRIETDTPVGVCANLDCGRDLHEHPNLRIAGHLSGGAVAFNLCLDCVEEAGLAGDVDLRKERIFQLVWEEYGWCPCLRCISMKGGL